MRSGWSCLIPVPVFFLLLGCSGSADLAAERDALLEADRAFDRETARLGAEGWAAAFADNGVMFPGRGRVEGREAIRAFMEPAFSEGAALRWEPGSAEVGSGGDLGYTLGRWRRVVPGEDGRDSVLATGNYVSIWRKVPGEGWKVAVDIGNDDPLPPD